jgi:hypothetical protein
MLDTSTYLFFVLFLIETIWDLFFRKDTIQCITTLTTGSRQLKIVVLIIIHHLLSTFLTFGWIMNSKIIIIAYLCSIFVVFGSWQLYNGLCYLTVMQNDMCGCNKKKPFNHLLQLMKIDETQRNKKYYYGIIILGVIVSFFKLIL